MDLVGSPGPTAQGAQQASFPQSWELIMQSTAEHVVPALGVPRLVWGMQVAALRVHMESGALLQVL